MDKRIAVLIPCFNEEATVGKVIDDFRAALPSADIYVFDNASTDRTAEIARQHGATVRPVKRRGKGNVVAAMLAEPPADIMIMVDGDDTYHASIAPKLVAPILGGQADMVVATRLEDFSRQAFRPLHLAGNRLVRGLINSIFGARLRDIMSGYRAFTAELARGVAVTAVGFEVETELTIQTLYNGFVIQEVPAPYRDRPAGSVSKLRTFRDGCRVLWTIFSIARSAKPLTFFGLLGVLFFLLGVLCGLPAVWQFFDHHKVESFPLLFVGVGLMICSFISLAIGIILHSINVRLKELSLLMRKK